jgi:CDGSH iron-sulfur domain-containing protein 3
MSDNAKPDEAKVAQKGPYQIALEANKPYFWCTCGRSAKQPFCDGAHKGTTFQPQRFTVDKAATYNLCGCKSTDDTPFCDGAHNML